MKALEQESARTGTTYGMCEVPTSEVEVKPEESTVREKWFRVVDYCPNRQGSASIVWPRRPFLVKVWLPGQVPLKESCGTIYTITEDSHRMHLGFVPQILFAVCDHDGFFVEV